MTLTLIEPPNAEPLSAADARPRLGIAATVPDPVIDALLKAARQNIEQKYGLAMLPQKWLLLDRFPHSMFPHLETGFRPRTNTASWQRHRASESDIAIPMTPLTADAITAVKYLDVTGTERTVEPANYRLMPGDLTSHLSLAYNATWPATALMSAAVSVEFTAGHADAAAVPETLKLAILVSVKALLSVSMQNLFVQIDKVEGVGEKRYAVSSAAVEMTEKVTKSLLSAYVRPSL